MRSKNKKPFFANLNKKYKRSLCKKIYKNGKSFSKLEENKNLFFSPNASLVEPRLKENLLSLTTEYNTQNNISQLYQHYIQNNKINEQAYLYSYNKLTAKIDVLKIINADQGKNLALAPSIVCKMISLLTYSIELASSALLTGVATATRYGIGQLSDRRKIKNSKNKLNHWITDLNFIKLLCILLTKTHESDFANQERLDFFLDEQFIKFWSLFKKQAKLDTGILDLNNFWSSFLLVYFRELKCPSLKGNFEHSLNEMVAILKNDMQVAYKQNLPNIQESDSFKTTDKENIFLLQFILQVTTLYYLTKLKSLVHKDKITLSKLTGPAFWQGANFNRTIDATKPTFLPGLVSY